MLYDRTYMRQAPEPAPKQTSVVTTLLIVTIGIFVLQEVLNVFFPGIGGRQNMFMTDWFALSAQNFKESKVWTVVSYAFLHSAAPMPLFFVPIPCAHLIFNMLGLFIFGRQIERKLGKTKFLSFYLVSAVIGGLIYILLHSSGNQIVIGASASVAALVTFFCLTNPDGRILILPIPIPLKSKWVLLGLIIISIIGLIEELEGSTYVAHSAHIGGILSGVLYFRYFYNSQSSFSIPSNRPIIEAPKWFKRRKKTKRKFSYSVNRSATNNKDLQKELDRILDKINDNEDGFGALSKAEQDTLEQAKDILNK